ncbi:MAG: SpoIIE family protein phosphatase [Lentisphaerae bacterium]|nr:SpoIIE family protein phosphatase [Lentisphaerota bacterium]MCP4102418.1 SpoIIE family protein phosphatase [Lentisphaerota bacterium]
MQIPLFLLFLFALSFSIMIFYAFYLSNKNFGLRNKIKDVLHQKAEIGNFLSLFSQSLRDIEEIDASMNTTARYIADLVEAESVCIYEVRDNYLRASGICGAFPLVHHVSNYIMTKPRYILESLRREKIILGEGLIGKVGEMREPLLIENASEDPRLHEYPQSSTIGCVMAVPMVRDAQLTGVICAVNNRRPGPFSPEQYSRLRFISSQVILAQNLVRVYRDLSKQQRINQELEFARQLQASLLPSSFPAWDQFVVNAFTRSSKEVNGDFYDFVEIDNDRLLIVLGDACGKGIPACMLTAMTRSFIRSAIEHFDNLESFLEEINNNLFRDTDEERFVTIACAILDRRNSLVEYARAGHTELLTHTHGHIRQIYPDGSALGILPNELSSFDSMCFVFNSDMSILMFSDGLTEALNAEGEEYGLERLQETFNQSRTDGDSPRESVKKIIDAVSNFASDQIDDQTMILINHC